MAADFVGDVSKGGHVSTFRYTPEEAHTRSRCNLDLGYPFHPSKCGPDYFEQLAAWTRLKGFAADAIASGELQRRFERYVADMFGVEDCTFVISGAAAGQAAVRSWCDAARINRFAMHPTAHLEVHEGRSYSLVHSLEAIPIGRRQRPLLAEDLLSLHDPVGFAVVELPTRHAGAQVPSWSELEELSKAAETRGVPLHLDGARVWTCRPHFGGRGYAEIAGKFKSLYVSLSKDVGAIGGGLLGGTANFVAACRNWAFRQGANGDRYWTVLIDGMRCLEERIERFDRYVAHARQLAVAIKGAGIAAVFPETPHTNILKVYRRDEP